MYKALIPLTVVVVLVTGYSLNWLRGEQSRTPAHRLTVQEICTSEAALRHKHFQPTHRRAMFLQPH